MSWIISKPFCSLWLVFISPGRGQEVRAGSVGPPLSRRFPRKGSSPSQLRVGRVTAGQTWWLGVCEREQTSGRERVALKGVNIRLSCMRFLICSLLCTVKAAASGTGSCEVDCTGREGREGGSRMQVATGVVTGSWRVVWGCSYRGGGNCQPLKPWIPEAWALETAWGTGLQ